MQNRRGDDDDAIVEFPLTSKILTTLFIVSVARGERVRFIALHKQVSFETDLVRRRRRRDIALGAGRR